MKISHLFAALAVIISSFGTSAYAAESAGNSGNRHIAVNTNLAYDVFAVLNAGVEFSVAPKFSVNIPVMWSLWDWRSDLGLRTVAVQPEARYWFSSVGKGNAVGVAVGAASFNFRNDEHRYQNVSGRPMVSASLTYTFALPVDKHWSFQFNIGIGYVNARYDRYYNIDNGARINTENFNYFGPTNVGINLCYRFGK